MHDPHEQSSRDMRKQNKADDAQGRDVQDGDVEGRDVQGGELVGLIEDLLPDAQPSAEFATSLKQRLDAKLDAKRNSLKPASAAPPVKRSTSGSPRKRRLKKGALGLLAAAAALMMMVFWPSQNAYSFESICRRMNSELFVHVQGSNAGERLVGWISGSGRFASVESSASVLVSKRDESVLQYQRGADRVTGDSTDSRSSQSRVLRLMNAIQAGAAGSNNALSEQGRSIELTDGADYQLDVTLADPVSESGSLQVRFGIDSKTGLPQWFRWLDADEPAAQAMAFGYPQQGPVDLVSLGIPNQVVDDYLKIASSDGVLGSGALGVDDGLARGRSSILNNPSMLNDSESPEALQAEDAIAKASQVVKSTAKTQTPVPVMPKVSTRKWRIAGEQIGHSISNSVAMASQIDRRIAEVWEKNDLSGQPTAGRYTVFRRLHLDLAGRIPRVSEIRADQKLASDDVESVVDALLQSPDFDSQMASVWTQWLLPPDVELEQFGGTPAFKGWLRRQFAEKVPYDEIARKLLTAEGRVGDVGPVLFTTALEMNPEHLAKQTARTFLGTRIDCAMCHDHPYDDWTQTDFWGYAALFARISRPKGKMNLMSSVLSVKDVGHGDVTLPETDTVIPPKFLGGEPLQEEPESNQRRQRLATWLTSPDNQQFARATVNMIWSHFFGAGIVEPRDDFGVHNPPLSEELLDELAGFFVKSDYDVRAVIRAIALSKTYSQTSLAELDSDQNRPMFDSMPIRWLNAEQLYDCLVVASGGLQGMNMSSGMNRTDNSSRDQFVEEFSMPGGSVLNYQAGIPQALSLMNGSFANRSAGETTSGIVIGLEAPFFSDRERVETVFLSVVGRPPSDEEWKTVSQMLEEAPELPTSVVLSDLVWALLNGAEFATNH